MIAYISYGVATCSGLLEIIGLLCKRALRKRRYSAKETYNFQEPTSRSHSISFQRSYMSNVFCGTYIVYTYDNTSYTYDNTSLRISYIHMIISYVYTIYVPIYVPIYVDLKRGVYIERERDLRCTYCVCMCVYIYCVCVCMYIYCVCVCMYLYCVCVCT